VASHPPLKLIETIVSLSQICVVRDELTRAYLRDCGVTELVPCPAVTYFTPQPPGRGLLHVDAYDDVGPELYALMNGMGADFATRTDRPFTRINNRISTNSQPQLTAALDAYRSADLILTGRLHGCILGLAIGRKVLAVSGARKIESFMEAAGLGEWVLDINTAGELEDRLDRLSQQSAPVEFLDQARRGNHEVARRIRALVRS
jgi:polysaccharide pyruvyl transferase